MTIESQCLVHQLLVGDIRGKAEKVEGAQRKIALTM
jgi:hypothetical protein